jgi:DNA processing protein
LDNERLAWIALAWAKGMGPRQFQWLVARFGSPGAVLAATMRDLAAAGLRADQARAIRAAGRNRARLRRRLVELADSGVQVVRPGEGGYPEALDIAGPPPAVCLLGQPPTAVEDAVAIVGTRTCTQEGFEFARGMAHELAATGAWVVSGLALGIDTAAHLGALDAGGRTLAVLGSGVDVVYPSQNRALASRIVESGCLLSESPPGARPSVARLMARNRLLAAMSKAVVVVEARGQGGSLVTARYAQRYGRPVFACDWQQDKSEAVGTALLVQRGAMPLSSPTDAGRVLAAARMWEAPPAGPSGQLTLPPQAL